MNFFKIFSKVSGMTMISRLLGFLRDILHTAYLGASPLSDAFIIALKFPNFFRRLFAEGALHAAFVPIFTDLYYTKSSQKAYQFAGSVFIYLNIILTFFTFIIEYNMPFFIGMLAPGLNKNAPYFLYLIDFARLTFPYLLFISLTSLYSSILNSLGYYSMPAIAPTLFNICIITALLLCGRTAPLNGYALSAAVTLSGVLQFLLLFIFALTRQIKIQLTPKITSDLKHLLKKMAPIAISGGVFQINIMIDTFLASFLPKGSISYLYFAERLNELPMGVIGIALSTALLPLLSKAIKTKNVSQALYHQNKASLTGILLGLPATFGLITLAYPIIYVLFGRGAFSQYDVVQTSYALYAYAFSIPAFILCKILTTTCFAHSNTYLPLKIALITITLNFIFNLIFMYFYAHVGLAISTTLTSYIQMGIYLYVLRKYGWYHVTSAFIKKLCAILSICGFMTGILMLLMHILPLSNIENIKNIFILGLYLLAGGGSYIFLLYFFRKKFFHSS